MTKGSLTLTGGNVDNPQAGTSIENDQAQGGFFGFTGDSRLARYFGGGAITAGNVRGVGGPVEPRLPIPHSGSGLSGRKHGTLNGAGASKRHPVSGNGGTSGEPLLSSSSSSSFSSSIYRVGSASGGGIYVNSGTVSITGSIPLAADAANYGGFLYNAAGGTVSISGATIAGNQADFGGAVINYGALTITDGSLNGNQATPKADVYAISNATFGGATGSSGGAIDNHGYLQVTGAIIANNTAAYGGGIDNAHGTAHVSGGTLSSNTAVNRGGGIYSIQGTLTITDSSEFEDNQVTATGSSTSISIGSGGGIDIDGGKVSITGITLNDNEARLGGGIYISSGNVSITGSGNTITGNLARYTAGGIGNQGTLTVENATISSNSAAVDGGGIYNVGSMSITNTTSATITGNSAGSYGGGVDNLGTLSVVNVPISNNTAGLGGGGAYNVGSMTISNVNLSGNVSPGVVSGKTFTIGRGVRILNTSVLTLTHVTLTQNTAGFGGGLYNTGGNVKATGFTVSSNDAKTGDGGGIYYHNGTLSLKQSRLVDNHASGTAVNLSYGRGGALYQAGGKIAISGTTSASTKTTGPGSIADNTAAQGGGIYLFGGSITLDLAHVANNTATQSGGAIYNGGTVVIVDSFVLDNTATLDGGGIDNTSKLSVLTITYSTLSNNTAGGEGGSIRNLGSATTTISTSTIDFSSATLGGAVANTGTLTITASTIDYNSASDLGGGVYDDLTGVVNLTNSTIAENTSQSSGGGVYTQGTLNAVNITIADNLIRGGAGGGLDVAGGSAALYNTIVDANSGTDLSGGLAATSSDNRISDPNLHLGPLTNNGGPTLTIALLQGSSAIDQGANSFPAGDGVTVPITDQRGAVRGGPTNKYNAGLTVDIGAYEASSAFLITSTVDSYTISGTLRLGLGWAAVSTNYNPENLTPSLTANAPNTLVFSTTGAFSVPQTITLTLGTLTMPTAHSVAIDGPAGGLVSISGGGEFQVINVPTGANATLEDITIKGGIADFGGGIENNGTLSLINTNLEGNSATADGGGLSSGGTLNITGGTVSGNSASNGAGIDANGVVNIANATITNNTTTGQGGGVDYSNSPGGSFTITDTTFTDNAAIVGGGLYLYYIGNGTATLTGGTFSGNSATGAGGGGLYLDGATLTVSGTAFTSDMAGSGSGGAIDVAAGSLTGTSLMLQTNSALSGGAIAIADSAHATISSNSNITSNSSTGSGLSGGGILNNGTLTVSDSTIAQNIAVGNGGGIESTGTLTLEGSTLADNLAFAGGALDTNAGTASLTNTTIAGNTASSGSGGINNTSGDVTTVNTTIAYNVNTAGGGGGIVTSAGSVTLYNTIVDSNTASGGTDVSGTFSPASTNNLIGVANADLGTLGNNGGPTETIALLTGSPAIDGGANTIAGVTIPSTDQRGALRGGQAYSVNAGTTVDIGAYEASSSYLVNTTNDTTNEISTLRTGVGWANVSFNDNPYNLGMSPTSNRPTRSRLAPPGPSICHRRSAPWCCRIRRRRSRSTTSARAWPRSAAAARSES